MIASSSSSLLPSSSMSSIIATLCSVTKVSLLLLLTSGSETTSFQSAPRFHTWGDVTDNPTRKKVQQQSIFHFQHDTQCLARTQVNGNGEKGDDNNGDENLKKRTGGGGKPKGAAAQEKGAKRKYSRKKIEPENEEDLKQRLRELELRTENAELRAQMEKERADKEKAELRADKEKALRLVAERDANKSAAFDAEAANESKERATAFLNSIMRAEYEPIPKSNGMFILRNIQMLNDVLGETVDIVVRNITVPFWQACIDKVDSSKGRKRIAAVGTPGTGKTRTTPILIRMLLERNCSVVFLMRSTDKVLWYYEFVPTLNASNGNAQRIAVNVYPETVAKTSIPLLQRRETYFIVDPGQTKDDCAPTESFEPKFILVTSPDSRHWGDNEFTKMRGNQVGGIFKYHPLWSWDEIQAANEVLIGQIPANETKRFDLEQRFHEMGGVPRNIYSVIDFYRQALKNQDRALALINPENAERIALGKIMDVDSMDPNQPKSAIMGYVLDPRDVAFDQGIAVLVSEQVKELVFFKFMKNLWSIMLRSGDDGFSIFESYTRRLLAGETKIQFDARDCVGKSDLKRNSTFHLVLGGCAGIRAAVDIVQASMKTPNVLFYPINRQYPLIDFGYQDTNGTMHMFQVTIGETHSSKFDDIWKLDTQVGNKSLNLYYLVTGDNFGKFVTNPVNPKDKQNSTHQLHCNIYHLLVPDPSKEETK